VKLVDDEVNKVFGDAVATEDVQHQRAVDRVKRLHQIDVQRPRTQPVLLLLEQGHLEREDAVRAPAAAEEAVLVLNAHLCK
jgi:hypothetical protein